MAIAPAVPEAAMQAEALVTGGQISLRTAAMITAVGVATSRMAVTTVAAILKIIPTLVAEAEMGQVMTRSSRFQLYRGCLSQRQTEVVVRPFVLASLMEEVIAKSLRRTPTPTTLKQAKRFLHRR
jgi:hypothetical protein